MTGPWLPDEDAGVDRTGLVAPSAPRSVAVARRYAADMCRALGWSESADTIALLVSELATNAILHSYGTHVRVRVVDHGPRLRVEVSDGSPDLPVPRGARPTEENGRGLELVEALAVAWGVDTQPDGKTAWFEIGV